MKVLEVESRITEVLEGTFGHPDRSEGLHASQIWEDINRSIGRGPKSPMSLPDLEEFGTIGFIWERVLETTLANLVHTFQPGRFFRPAEQFVDGVYLTPDYLDLDFNGDNTWEEAGLEEWKVTWKSSRQGDDLEKNFWKWIVQQKAYCHALDLRRSRLRALFIVGNWRDSIVPKLRTWEFEFTELELRENWSMLTNHARRKGWL